MTANYYTPPQRKKKATIEETAAKNIAAMEYAQLNYYLIGERPVYRLTFKKVLELAKNPICKLPRWGLTSTFSLDGVAGEVLQDARDFACAFLRTDISAMDATGKSVSAEGMVISREVAQNTCDPISRVCQDMVDVLMGQQKPISTDLFDRIGNLYSHFSGRMGSEYAQFKYMSDFVSTVTYCLVRVKNGEPTYIGRKALSAIENMIAYPEKDGLKAYMRSCAILFHMIVLLFQGQVTADDYAAFAGILGKWIETRRG